MSGDPFTLDRWAARISTAFEALKADPDRAEQIREKVDRFFLTNPGTSRDLESEAVLTVIFFEAAE